MSSLRRRAIVVSRARSAERSSIGGRVSARAAAAESSGSASTRSQAIASRTSGRWKSAAGPARWNGMPRSSIAAATGAALAGRVVDQDADLLRRGAVGEQVLDLPRHRLRLRPLVASSARSEPRARGSRARGPSTSPAEVWNQASRRREGPAGEVSVSAPPAHPRSSRLDSSRRRGGSGSRGQGRQDCALGRGRVLELVDHHDSGSGRRSRGGRRGARRGGMLRARKTSPLVEAAGGGEDAVVGGEELANSRSAGPPGVVGAASRSPAFERVRSSPCSERRGQQARPGCRGSRGGAAAGPRAGRAASPAARPGRARRRRGRGRRGRRARAAAARRVVSQVPIQSSSKGPRAAPRRALAAAARWPGSRRGPASARARRPSPASRASRRASASVLPVPAAPQHEQGPVAVEDGALPAASAKASMVQR